MLSRMNYNWHLLRNTAVLCIMHRCVRMYIYIYIHVCTSLLASSSRAGIDYYLRSPINYPAKQPAAPTSKDNLDNFADLS